MEIKYSLPEQLGNGWYFKRTIGMVELNFGPYPDELNCHYNLQRLRRDDIATPNGALQQNLFDPGGWRATVQDIFGTTSIGSYPPRGSRG